MSKRGSYAVRISGLGEGDHDFIFELNQQFFALFEQPEIEKGKVQAKITFEKKAGILVLHFSLKGKVEVICDRCLEPFMIPVETSQNMYLKLGDTKEEIEDDVLMITRDEHEIELAQYMYEFIILALPYQRLHPSDRDGKSLCNPEMLKKLEAHRAYDMNRKIKTDPRWDVLKSITEKNK